MFIKSINSFIKDSILVEAKCKYKVKSVIYSSHADEVKIISEFIENGGIVTFDLKRDIINGNKLPYYSNKDIIFLSRISDNILPEKLRVDEVDKYFNFISMMFTVCLLISNLAVAKTFNFLGYSLTGGILIFPMLYVLGDIITEVYGFSVSRRIILTALIYNCAFSIIMYLMTCLPATHSLLLEEEMTFKKIYSLSPRIFLASSLSYLLGELANAFVLSYLKFVLKSRLFLLRAVSSTFIGSFLESSLFCLLAFSGGVEMIKMFDIIIMATGFKVGFELIIMPVTLFVINYLKNKRKCIAV